VRNIAPPRLALVGTFKYPDESASTRRVLALKELIESAGIQVCLGSADPTPDLLPREFHGAGCQVLHLSEYPQRSTPSVFRALRQFIWGGRATAWLNGLKPRPTAVLLYGGYSPFSLWLLQFRRRTGIPLIVDVVEWYQPSHIPGGWFGPFHLNYDSALNFFFPRFKNIITISRYLQRHFTAKGCQVLYLPAVLDVKAVVPDLETRPEGSTLRLAYTGTPGKKDLLDPMVEALMRMDPEGTKLRFNIVGPSIETILALPALRKRGVDQVPPCLEVPGYVSNAKATAYVREADFSILLRHRQRYAMAGFPTKVPESLAAGTPVICNLTSDLGDFIQDGHQGLICDHPTAESCRATLERALAMSHGQRAEMRRKARRLAEDSFDYRKYISLARSFFSEITLHH